jgi:IS30 family transposase
MGGPQRYLTKEQRRELVANMMRGETSAELAEKYSVGPSTISRIKIKYLKKFKSIEINPGTFTDEEIKNVTSRVLARSYTQRNIPAVKKEQSIEDKFIESYKNKLKSRAMTELLKEI